MNKIFNNYLSALYGRKDVEITLREFDFITVYEILKDHKIKNFEDKFKLWSMFGGFPKYYELLELFQIKSFDEFVEYFNTFSQLDVLYNEGLTILKSEFGGEFKNYFSLLEAIATGKTKFSEIASVYQNSNIANRYLNEMISEYDFIIRQRPLIGKGHYYQIKYNFIDFWFSFIRKYRYLIELNNINAFLKEFKENFNRYLGKMFERFVKWFIQKYYQYDIVTKQWGKFKDRVYEIDIVAINENKNEILFAECKWKNNVNAKKVLKDLREKAKFVKLNKQRKEKYAIFAKSFKVKTDEAMCVDLKEMENRIKDSLK